jgi:hypothetical protein
MFRILGFTVSLVYGTFQSELQYSVVSSLVTKARIGIPAQELSIGLDFNGNDSVLFGHGEYCPAYVDHCFDPEQSTSWEEGSPGSDSLEIGSMSVSKVPLALVKSSNTVRFRETAGSIAAGKQSSFFIGKRVTIKESSDTQTVVMTTQAHVGVVKLPSTDPVKWGFQAELVLQIEQIHIRFPASQVVFDPAIQNILIPRRFESFIPVNLRSGDYRDGDISLRLACNTVGNWVRFDLTGYAPVSIPSGQLLSLENQGGFCESRIYLSDDVEEITIGRLLTRSVEHVILDYQTSSLELSPLQDTSKELSVFTSPVPLVHTFQNPPEVTRNQNGQLVYQWLKRWSLLGGDHSILVSQTPRVDPDDGRKTCWTFFYLKPVAGKTYIDKLPEVYSQLEFVDEPHSDALIMRFGIDSSSEDKFQVSLDYRRDRLVVCKHQVEDCPICLTGMESDQSIHKTACCRKCLHADCIQGWLTTGKSSCPFCRRHIQGTSTDNSTVPYSGPYRSTTNAPSNIG